MDEPYEYQLYEHRWDNNIMNTQQSLQVGWAISISDESKTLSLTVEKQQNDRNKNRREMNDVTKPKKDLCHTNL